MRRVFGTGVVSAHEASDLAHRANENVRALLNTPTERGRVSLDAEGVSQLHGALVTMMGGHEIARGIHRATTLPSWTRGRRLQRDDNRQQAGAERVQNAAAANLHEEAFGLAQDLGRTLALGAGAGGPQSTVELKAVEVHRLVAASDAAHVATLERHETLAPQREAGAIREDRVAVQNESRVTLGIQIGRIGSRLNRSVRDARATIHAVRQSIAAIRPHDLDIVRGLAEASTEERAASVAKVEAAVREIRVAQRADMQVLDQGRELVTIAFRDDEVSQHPVLGNVHVAGQLPTAYSTASQRLGFAASSLSESRNRGMTSEQLLEEARTYVTSAHDASTSLGDRLARTARNVARELREGRPIEQRRRPEGWYVQGRRSQRNRDRLAVRLEAAESAARAPFDATGTSQSVTGEARPH
jgi:hypothetical protein